MNKAQYKIRDFKSHPGLIDEADQLCGDAWPEFMLHDTMVDKYWAAMYADFPEYQFAMTEADEDNILAVGNCVPINWDGPPEELPQGGIDWILPAALEKSLDPKHNAKNLFAIQIVVNADLKGRHLSGKAVKSMLEIGRAAGCGSLYAPVRPNKKHEYPLTAMDEYIGWKNDDGLPFDPWMRVHARLGAEIVSVCHESMRIPGTISDWENWTGMKFPSSGDYIIPGALVPVQMDIEKDLGLYIEPNVWMRHGII